MSKIDKKAEELSKRMQDELGNIELNVIGNTTLADMIRLGSTVTEHNASGWGDGDTACALTDAVIAARSMGYL